MNPSSSAAEPNSSSLLSSSVPVSLLKSWMVWWNFAPWPPKFSAVVVEQVGERALAVGAVGAERHGQVVDAAGRSGRARAAWRCWSVSRIAPSASIVPPVVDRGQLDEAVADDRRRR